MNAEDIVARARALPRPLVAIEAWWDGDTEGWFLVVTAIIDGGDTELAVLRQGGDIRLFDGSVPPWPESAIAMQAGTQLARELGIPFHFPSPDQPRDECTRWREIGQGEPCGDCGREIRRDDTPWKGFCYPCHLEREMQKPRLRIELVDDVDEATLESLRASIEAPLLERGLGSYRFASLVPGSQVLSFEVNDPAAAGALAIAALRDADRLRGLRVRLAHNGREAGKLIWPR